MALTFIFLVLISSLIFLKLRDVSRRNNLNVKSENRLLFSGGLVSLFVITNATLPYPQSLYWFLFLGVLLLGVVLCLNTVKKEVLRFKSLRTKDRVMNVLFYSLFIVLIHIYI